MQGKENNHMLIKIIFMQYIIYYRGMKEILLNGVKFILSKYLSVVHRFVPLQENVKILPEFVKKIVLKMEIT
jgi:hypothetical protein